jgi:hypothetical protein
VTFLNGHKSYADASKTLQGGKYGWYCPCCNPYGCSPRKMKAKAHRIRRRSEKQNVAIFSENDD